VLNHLLLSSRPTGHVDAERGLEDGDLSTLREYVWLVLLVVLEHHCAHLARRHAIYRLQLHRRKTLD
jgi:hypothetical protein